MPHREIAGDRRPLRFCFLCLPLTLPPHTIAPASSFVPAGSSLIYPGANSLRLHRLRITPRSHRGARDQSGSSDASMHCNRIRLHFYGTVRRSAAVRCASRGSRGHGHGRDRSVYRIPHLCQAQGRQHPSSQMGSRPSQSIQQAIPSSAKTPACAGNASRISGRARLSKSASRPLRDATGSEQDLIRWRDTIYKLRNGHARRRWNESCLRTHHRLRCDLVQF
jgi:hypothetical protein